MGELAQQPEDIGDFEGKLDRDAIMRWYGSLPASIYTLFGAISGGWSWNVVAEPLLSISPLLGILFCLYISFAIFCVLNVVTGVFVENANTLIASDRHRMLMSQLKKRETWMNEV